MVLALGLGSLVALALAAWLARRLAARSPRPRPRPGDSQPASVAASCRRPARLEADDFRIAVADVDLAALVTVTPEAWQARARSAGIAVTAQPAPADVRADPVRLRQVLDALLDNARG